MLTIVRKVDKHNPINTKIEFRGGSRKEEKV
jgi:hypothetical protein